MGIIAIRQRRRFNQIRKLGISVPITYKRVYSILSFPKLIQEALVKYPETITEDTDYEQDKICEANFSENPILYIESSDQRRREEIEQNA